MSTTTGTAALLVMHTPSQCVLTCPSARDATCFYASRVKYDPYRLVMTAVVCSQQLGGAGKAKNSMLDSLMAEERIAPISALSSSAANGGSAGGNNSSAQQQALVPDVVTSTAPAYPVTVVVEEKLR